MFNTAIILAGGAGTRLKDIAKQPKPLILINGKPHIINVINHLFLWNLSKIIILVRKGQTSLYQNHLKILCKEAINNLNIEIVEEAKPMGTSGWILNNLSKLDDYFIVLNADTYFYENIYSYLRDIYSKKQNAILAKQKRTRSDSGVFQVNDLSLIEKFEEKNNSNHKLESAGIYLLKKSSLEKLKKSFLNSINSFEFDIFPELIKQKKLYGYKSFTFNHDYGTVQRLEDSEEITKKHQIKWLFLDRDNTLNYDYNSYTHKISDLKRIKKLDPILKGYQDIGYHLCVITNQSGIARNYYKEEDMNNFNKELSKKLANIGISIQLFLHCPHLPDADCDCRKPKTGLLDYVNNNFGIDIKNSIFIGDSESDIICANNYNISSLKFKLI